MTGIVLNRVLYKKKIKEKKIEFVFAFVTPVVLKGSLKHVSPFGPVVWPAIGDISMKSYFIRYIIPPTYTTLYILNNKALGSFIKFNVYLYMLPNSWTELTAFF